MFKIILVIFSLVIISITNYAVAEQEYDYDLHPIEEYDLSDHPIFQPWEFNPDRNFSSQIYSNSSVSNPYYLKSLNLTYDPTVRYYEKPMSAFDYCDLEQFSKFPKCLEQINQNKTTNQNNFNWKDGDNSLMSEINLRELFGNVGISYDSLPTWMISNLKILIDVEQLDSDEVMDRIEDFVESSSWN